MTMSSISCVDMPARILSSDIDHGTFLYPFNILRRLEQISSGYGMPHALEAYDLLVKSLVACLIFFSAAAPAGSISLDFSVHS